jgi:hypothetical protein
MSKLYLALFNSEQNTFLIEHCFIVLTAIVNCCFDLYLAPFSYYNYHHGYNKFLIRLYSESITLKFFDLGHCIFIVRIQLQ